MIVSVTLPLRLVSVANVREHGARRGRRFGDHKHVVYCSLYGRLRDAGLSGAPCRATITRLGPRRLDPDNKVAAMKGVIDGIAAAVGVDDGDPRWDWVWRQEASKTYGVRIEIEALDVATGDRARDSHNGIAKSTHGAS